MILKGRVWCFGDDINTDLIEPIPVLLMPRSEHPKHMFRANRPGWAAQVQQGDILVAGKNYGMGSGRPAAQVMKDLGLGCLLAETINGLFFRNSVNYAFPALEIKGIREAFEEGDVAEVDFENGVARNLRTGVELRGAPWPESALKVLRAGGLIAYLQAEGYLNPLGWRPWAPDAPAPSPQSERVM
jgi:3-isopropylmalate/(R)-2-methylmalate dehydratase small subunit